VPDGKRLIVNADEFGRTAGVNRGILDAHDRGIVTSASLLVTSPAAPEAVRLSAAAPRLGVGLTFAFTDAAAALPPSELPSLTDVSGHLQGAAERLASAPGSEVLAEARAQLRRFRETVGRSPTHLGAYRNVHRFPVVLEAVVTLAWETGLPVRSLSPEMRSRFRREGIRTPDRYVEPFSGAGATLEGLLQVLGGLDIETAELLCHPAAVDEAARAASDARARELEALTHQEARHAVQAAGIRLMHFGEL